LTPRFAALASHYLLEACFCRKVQTHTTGNATLIGKYSFETQECFDNGALTFSGSFTITAANGDTLFGSYVGSVTEFIDDDTPAYVFTATVDDGTGRFAAEHQ